VKEKTWPENTGTCSRQTNQ